MRWRFFDPVTFETWDMPISPNQMSSPLRQKQLETLGGGGGAMPRTRRVANVPREWSFGGVIRGEAMHTEMHRWFTKAGFVHVRDHLSRTWEVMLVELQDSEQRPTPRQAWRFTYNVRCYVNRRVN